MATRGERNRNPGNLRQPEGAAPILYEGLIGADDERHMIFENHTFGVRAMVKNLMVYRDRHDRNTIREIGVHWAENSRPWVSNVSSFMRIGADEELPWGRDNAHRAEVFRELVSAISRQENAGWVPPEKAIIAGIRLAGVPTRRTGGLLASRTVRNGALSVGSSGISAGTLLAAVPSFSQLDWKIAVPVVFSVVAVLLTSLIIKYRAQDEKDWNP